MSTYLDAKAYLKVWPDTKIMNWFAICPFCERIHQHGAGRDKTKIMETLGLRVSNCGAGKSYNLVYAGKAEDIPKDVIRKARRRFR